MFFIKRFNTIIQGAFYFLFVRITFVKPFVYTHSENLIFSCRKLF